LTPDRQKDGAAVRPELGSATPDAEPLTRRRLRELERERERANERASEGRRAPVVRPVPLATTASRSRHASLGRVPRARKAAAKGLSLLAMTFVVTMAVATSVPAMALLTKDDVQTRALESQLVSAVKAAPQAMTLEAGGTVGSVIRDGVDVTSAEKVSALSHMRIADTFTNNPRGAIQWPFPIGVPISDGYGPRVAPTDGASSDHPGIDFTPGAGVPIQIIADGVVRQVVEQGDGCGVNVTIDHMIGGALVSSKYCHMQSGSVRVSVGQQVKVADVVGLVGNTGISTGAHLHLEILLNGTEHTDPYAWLKANASA
jgi:murein DD-endopeptidase MepM/ murein hydrolase activator NlpD